MKKFRIINAVKDMPGFPGAKPGPRLTRAKLCHHLKTPGLSVAFRKCTFRPTHRPSVKPSHPPALKSPGEQKRARSAAAAAVMAATAAKTRPADAATVEGFVNPPPSAAAQGRTVRAA